MMTFPFDFDEALRKPKQSDIDFCRMRADGISAALGYIKIKNPSAVVASLLLAQEFRRVATELELIRYANRPTGL